MIAIDEAFVAIDREVRPLGAERVDIFEANGRVLAEDIVADTDLPPFDRSQMDGYAVIAADTENAPVQLEIIGESAAGKGWNGTLAAGQAVRIMTGARVPDGADAVQKLEVAAEGDGLVRILEPVSAGKFIVAKGTEVRQGTVVLKAGERLDPRSIAVPAAFGYANVNVGKRPRVTVLATGSEIVDVTETPAADQIRNSNSVMLAALCREAGAEVATQPIAGDDLVEIRTQLSAAVKKSDVLVVTGGVSVGKYDLTKAALRDIGAEIFFERVRLKPGKPTVFARAGETLIFGLPGNPVSAVVTFYLFVRRALALMQNDSNAGLRQATARLNRDIKGAEERDTFLPASIMTADDGRLAAEPLKWHGSSDLIGFAGAECLVYVAAGSSIAAGEPVSVFMLNQAPGRCK